MILALNTTSTVTTVALGQDLLFGESLRQEGRILPKVRVIKEVTHPDPRAQTAGLVAMVMDLLESCTVRPQAITTLLYVRGPGSFTGVRLGVATVLGLRMAGRYASAPFAQTVYGVSALEVLLVAAQRQCPDQPLLATLDTLRGDYYAQGCGIPQLDTLQILTHHEVHTHLDHGVLRVGQGTALDDPSAALALEVWPLLQAQGRYVEGLSPLYGRPSYVEAGG